MKWHDKAVTDGMESSEEVWPMEEDEGQLRQPVFDS